ncbi:MAG: ACP phosphodiesterase [Bacteroidales bacterium]
MNFLAHILLSGNNPHHQIGGFIADYVKGRRFEGLSPAITEGILLHRKIDTYTDSHLLFLQMQNLLRPTFGRYSGIFLDIYYDYCLAKNWRKFSKESLAYFTYRFYYALWKNRHELPLQVKSFLWHFIFSNRLYSYRKIKGIERTLWIMGKYTSLPQQSKEAALFLQKNERILEQNFLQFFPLLIKVASDNGIHQD